MSSDDPDGDGETYGWSLSDSWHEIGSVFLFLLSMYNLIDTHKDESPIIDTKGIKNGMQEYSVHLSVLDLDRQTPLNILEYETVRDLIGKHLKVKLTLKRAKDIPEKYSFQTMAKYEWIDNDKGDEVNPDYRSRLVAQEIKVDKSQELFAGAPPLEAKKMLMSLATTHGVGIGQGGRLKMDFIDICRS